MKFTSMLLTSSALALAATAANAQPPAPMVYEGSAGGVRILEEGQRPVIIHPTVDGMEQFRKAHGIKEPGKASHHGGGGSVNLTYHGGVGGIGVETAPKIYLILWGSQWNNNDPSAEAATLESFFQSMGGSSWFNSNTQYCQGVATGTTFCNGAGQAAGNQPNMYAGVWADNATAAPSAPRQSQIAAEAVNAAQHFGNTTAASNASVNYIIATATGNNSSGFKTQYCAYHSSTSSASVGGNVAYTNAPYITDAGASCGANFNGLGPNAGITIVIGHEVSEAATDQFPNGGWLDGSGEENGDKCAWISSGQGASANVAMSGNSFPVQSLWSNAFNNDAGGCVLSY